MTSQLDRKVVDHVLLMTAVAVLGRGMLFGGHLVLGYLLPPAEMGVYGVAVGVAAFTGMLAQFGLKETLVKRGARLVLWAPSAQTLALAAALVAWLILSLVAQFVVWTGDYRVLRTVIPLLGAMFPLTALGLIPEAQLTRDLAFRSIARVTLVAQTVTTLLQIAGVAAGLGLYALVFPMVLGAALRTTLLWRASSGIRLRIGRPRSWPVLLATSRWMALVAGLNVVWWYGDYVVLGAFFSAEEAGHYYFAFTLAMTTMSLLSSSVALVLFPALSSLDKDHELLWATGKRALSMLGLIGLPLCALQVLVGIPFIRMLFGTKWLEAEPFFVILSAGMALRVVGAPAGSIMQAVGRFRYQAGVMACLAALFVASALPGILTGSILAFVVGVAAFYASVGPFNIYCAARVVGGSMREVVAIYFRPVVMTGLAVLPGLEAGGLFADGTAVGHALQGIAGGLVFLIVYGVGTMLVSGPTVRDLVRLLPVFTKPPATP